MLSWVSTILILLAAYGLIYLESALTIFRKWTGAQPDLIPGLVVYIGLSAGLGELTLFAVIAGIWMDALSANPLGISVLPLFATGWFLRQYRGLVVRDQIHTQWIFGAAAHALVPLATVLLLWFCGRHPLIGWFSLWQWFVMILLGTAFTPVWFQLFDWCSKTFNYRPAGAQSFRPDREIKRGRS